MNEGRTVFAQLMSYLPLRDFHRCVERYHGDHRVRRFSCLDQFLCMAIAKKELALPLNLYTFSQVLSVNLFQKDEIQQLLTTFHSQNHDSENRNQLLLFNL
jgi:hypothetical protein